MAQQTYMWTKFTIHKAIDSNPLGLLYQLVCFSFLNLNDTEQFECCSKGYLKVHAKLQNEGFPTGYWCWMDSNPFFTYAILKWIILGKDPPVQISCPQDRVAKVQKQLKALEQWRCSVHLLLKFLPHFDCSMTIVSVPIMIYTCIYPMAI